MDTLTLTSARWAEDDLLRVGCKIAEFADDQFNPASQKRELLEEVCSAIRRFEARHEVAVT